MTNPSDAPSPGERQSIIIVWEIDDPTKAGDPRYWFDDRYLQRMRNFAPDFPDVAGKPKGQSLASLRARAEGDEAEWVFPGLTGANEFRVRVSLAPWQDADPDRTYLIVLHQHTPSVSEREAMEAERGGQFPAEVETTRQELLAAVAANEEERADELRHQLGASAKAHGFFSARDFDAWDPAKAVEVQPGVFVQDERPGSAP